MARLDGLLQTIAKGLGKGEEDENPFLGLLGLSTNSQGIPLQNANFEGNGLYEEGVDRALASRNSIDFGTALPFQGVPDAKPVVGELNPNFDSLNAADDTRRMMEQDAGLLGGNDFDRMNALREKRWSESRLANQQQQQQQQQPTTVADTIQPTTVADIIQPTTVADTTKPTTPAEVTAQSQNELRSVITQTQGLDPVQRQGFFKTLFNDKEAMIRLALGFNTMRLKPDDALAKVLGKELEDIRKDKGTNMSFEFLKKTRPDLYNLVKGGSMTIKEAVSVLNLDKFSGNISLPTMPKDYQGKWDPKTNSFSMSVIPGSKTAAELADAENKKGIKKSERVSKTSMMNTNIDKALAIVDTEEWATGVKGAFVRDYGGFLGAGSPAINLQATLVSIKANIGFDRLQQMREESPTGGALGQVAVQELEALQSTLGSLDPRQSPELIKETLENVRNNYNRIIFEAYGQEILDKYGFSGGTKPQGSRDSSIANDDPLGIR